jgi:hypothetical protein
MRILATSVGELVRAYTPHDREPDTFVPSVLAVVGLSFSTASAKKRGGGLLRLQDLSDMHVYEVRLLPDGSMSKRSQIKKFRSFTETEGDEFRELIRCADTERAHAVMVELVRKWKRRLGLSA